ncbi:calcium-binding protein [Roseovarius sp.]|uniref:calcium-binding protein n=1 Tax=Roseovarius sp. TaxID=1486281 RepID=UPI003BAA1EAF
MTGVQPSVDVVVTADSGATFSYTIDNIPPDGLPEVLVDEDSYGITIDGVSVPETASVEFGVVNFGAGNSAVIMIVTVEGPVEDTHYVIQISGDPLPAINTVADFNALNASITSVGAAGAPFGEGDDIAWESLPGATSVEDDMIDGDDTAELLNGGIGDDTINGNGGDDTINGDAGNDQLDGGADNDRIFGNDGNDEIFGGLGNDTINPGDNLGGATGFDGIDAGPGDDTIDFSDASMGFFTLSHNSLTGPIVVNIDGELNTGSISAGAEGTDTLVNVVNPLNAGWTTGGLDLRGTAGNDVFNLNIGAEQWMTLRPGAGSDVITVSGDGQLRVDFRGGGAINADLAAGTVMQDGDTDTIVGNIWELRGTEFADTVMGSAADESFISEGGDDTIDGGAGFDRVRYDRSGVEAGLEVDLLTGTATGTWNGNPFSQTLANIEEVRGSAEGDYIRGDASANILRGNDGDDDLRGWDGVDTIDGGAGDDLLKGGAGGDLLNGGDGDDLLRGQNGSDIMNGGADNDTLLGNNGEDTMNGDAGNDSIKGGFNWDTIDGGAGDDTMLGQNGNDTVSGGEGNDSVLGNNGDDFLYGNFGEDFIDGSNGNDYMDGGLGNDTLLAGPGRDTLVGGEGDDELTGENGPDVFLFNPDFGTGNDTITDFENGFDTIEIRGSTEFGDLTIEQVGGDTVVSWDGGSVTLLGETGVIDENDFTFG